MGKKPVVAMVGLIWAGVLASGCGECCRSNNTRKTVNPPPTMMSKNLRNDGPTTGLVSDKDVPPPKPGDSASPIVPASAPGKQVSANVPADGTAPEFQRSLTPRQHPGFASGGANTPSESVIGRSSDVGSRMPMPTPPVSTRSIEPSAQTPPASRIDDSLSEASTRLPEIGSSAPPALPARSSAPQPLPPVADSGSIPPPPPLPGR